MAKDAPETTTDEAPQPVTREELLKISQHADSLASILRKEREASARRDKDLADMRAMIEQIAKPQESKPDEGAKPDPKLAQYEAKLKEMEAKFEAERKAREQEQSARVTQERRTALSQALTGKGVTGPHLKAAMAYIFDAQNLIVHDDKGQVGIKVQRSGYDEVVPIDDGLEELFKHDDYKIFLPPRNAQGAGTTPAKPANRSNGKLTKEDALRMLPGALLGAMHK